MKGTDAFVFSRYDQDFLGYGPKPLERIFAAYDEDVPPEIALARLQNLERGLREAENGERSRKSRLKQLETYLDQKIETFLETGDRYDQEAIVKAAGKLAETEQADAAGPAVAYLSDFLAEIERIYETGTFDRHIAHKRLKDCAESRKHNSTHPSYDLPAIARSETIPLDELFLLAELSLMDRAYLLREHDVPKEAARERLHYVMETDSLATGSQEFEERSDERAYEKQILAEYLSEK